MRSASLMVVFALTAVSLACAAPTPNYETYTSLSADNNYVIYQTVVVDGTTTGDCNYTCNCNRWGCSTCSYPNCPGNHTPSIYNVVNGVGGWTYGPAVPMYNYLSYQVTNSVNGQPGGKYDTFSAGQVTCPAIGAMLGGSTFGYNIAIAVTKSKTDWSAATTGSPSPIGGGAVQCVVNAWCTPESSPPACNPGIVDDQPLIPGGTAQCRDYYVTHWFAWKSTSETLWHCSVVGPWGGIADRTSDPSLGVCTKQ